MPGAAKIHVAAIECSAALLCARLFRAKSRTCTMRANNIFSRSGASKLFTFCVVLNHAERAGTSKPPKLPHARAAKLNCPWMAQNGLSSFRSYERSASLLWAWLSLQPSPLVLATNSCLSAYEITMNTRSLMLFRRYDKLAFSIGYKVLQDKERPRTWHKRSFYACAAR